VQLQLKRKLVVLEYTQSLEYARDIASRNVKNSKPATTQIHNQLSISYVTKTQATSIGHDVVLSTCCNIADALLHIYEQPFEEIPWSELVYDWIIEKFYTMELHDEETDTDQVFVVIQLPSKEQDGIEIELLLESILRSITTHCRVINSIKHNKPDSIPLWYKNETTKQHDLNTVAKYKGNGGPTVPLGGNFLTTLIKEPITFKKVFVNRVNRNGELKTVVQQNLVWKGEDIFEVETAPKQKSGRRRRSPATRSGSKVRFSLKGILK